MKPLLLLCFVALAAHGCTAQPQTQLLFNGKDLAGWHVDVPAMDTSSVESPFFVRK